MASDSVRALQISPLNLIWPPLLLTVVVANARAPIRASMLVEPFGACLFKCRNAIGRNAINDRIAHKLKATPCNASEPPAALVTPAASAARASDANSKLTVNISATSKSPATANQIQTGMVISCPATYQLSFDVRPWTGGCLSFWRFVSWLELLQEHASTRTINQDQVSYGLLGGQLSSLHGTF